MSSSSEATYDEQLGITFAQSFNSIQYNVTAVAQQDSDSGDGPAYLLNGLSDQGFWYQVGISYNWPNAKGGHVAGFNMNYEVFDFAGDSVFPLGGGGGIMAYSSSVHSGDKVVLNLYFASGDVVMFSRDLNTSAEASTSFSGEGATRFVGSASPSNSNGFFTGLMTEWYHPAPYYGDEQQVQYSDKSFGLTSALMWIDEYNSQNVSQLIFFATSSPLSYSNPTQLHGLSSHNATEYSDAFEFVTGGLKQATLTVSYTVMGGGAHSPPVLRYVLDGQTKTVTINSSQSAIAVDLDSDWSIDQVLGGSTSTERWQTNQAASGIATTSETLAFVYFNQFYLTLSYSISGSGTPNAPTFETNRFGSLVSQALSASSTGFWFDAGSPWTVQPQLQSNTPGLTTQRWLIGSSSNGTITNAETYAFDYHHQFSVSFSYLQLGGGSLPAVTLTETYLGNPRQFQIFSAPGSYWVDDGGEWTVPPLVKGTVGGERWATESPASGETTQAGAVQFVYQHEFLLSLASAEPEGGAVGDSGGWYNASETVVISASPREGWELAAWNGTGPGSFSGQGNSVPLLLAGPINESAVFYPGLTISASGGGSVNYSYGQVSGSVGASSSETVFVPSGTEVTLTSNPQFFYRLVGWSQNASTTSSERLSISGPSVVDARYVPNEVMIDVILLAVIVVAVGVVLASRRRQARAAFAAAG